MLKKSSTVPEPLVLWRCAKCGYEMPISAAKEHAPYCRQLGWGKPRARVPVPYEPSPRPAMRVQSCTRVWAIPAKAEQVTRIPLRSTPLISGVLERLNKMLLERRPSSGL